MNTARVPFSRPCSRGFTLIELIIAVAILGILTAVALPSFLDSMRKGRRAEAFSAISALQQAQERWRGNNAAYTSTLANLNVAATTTPGGYYAISVANATATGYVVTADGSSSSQASDGNCGKLSVQVNGGAITYGSCKSCSIFTYAASDACWAK
jgi:type IV pilus assembly protein PilE